MQSASARAAGQRLRERVAAMTPAERVALAERLGEEGLAAFIATHQLDRRTAIARIKATRRLGSRPSSSAAIDDR